MKLHEICKGCGLKVKAEHRTKSGYADPCLGVLPGVKYACCGHGDPDDAAYIFFENGVIVRFESLVEVEVKRYSKFHAFNDQTTAPKEF
jgi:hypothetical protein